MHAATPPMDRPDPYALVFGAPLFEEETFPHLLEEAAAEGLERAGPARFVQLTAVGELLRKLVPEDAPGAATRSHGTFLYHAYNHWRGGQRTLDVDAAALTAALAPPTDAPPVTVRVPAPAGYVRLPHQRLWARIEPEAAAEPVDGFFWVAGEPTERPARLDVLLALGLREGRPGLSVLEGGTPLAEGALPPDIAADPRPGGEAFANILPGGELQEYRGLMTPAEALLLAARLLARLSPSRSG
ncbi:MAG: hypothetical protein WEB88_16055 [Gemmatimonadota bacterium]